MLNKAKIIFLAFLAMSIFLTSCEDDTTEEDPILPSAPTNLQATSIDSTTIHIRWELSSDHGTEGFVGYNLNVTDVAGNSIVSNEAHNDYVLNTPVPVNNLTEGEIYTIRVTAVNADGESEAAEIQWSPAVRLNETLNNVEISIYGSGSENFGSGLKVYSEDLDFGDIGPEVLTIGRKAEWNLAFDNTGDMFRFGSANLVSVGPNADNPVYPAELSSVYYNSDDLSKVFDSKALNDGTFQETLVDLSDATYSDYSGLVLIFRVPTEQSGVYNYGKILIKKDTSDGDYIFDGGTEGPYIQCVVSYQRTENVPYAKLGF